MSNHESSDMALNLMTKLKISSNDSNIKQDIIEITKTVHKNESKKDIEQLNVQTRHKITNTTKEKEELKLPKLTQQHKENLNEELLKKIEAERQRRKDLLEDKKKKQYNIDNLKDRQQIKQRVIESVKQAEEKERKKAEQKMKKQMRIQAKQEAAKIKEFNEKIRRREEARLSLRRFSKELADRPVLISRRIAVVGFNYNNLDLNKILKK